MEHGALSDRIRKHAVDKFVQPARQKRQKKVSLAVRDLMNDLESLRAKVEDAPPEEAQQAHATQEA